MSAHRIKALQAIVADGASTSNEKTIARRLLARMGAEEVPPPTVRTNIKFKGEPENILIQYIAHSLGCSLFTLRKAGATRGRFRSEYVVEGPEGVTDLCKVLFQRHRKSLSKALEGALHGYCHGAFPQPPSDSDVDIEDVDQEYLDMYFKGRSTGASARQRDQRTLEDRGGK